MESIKTFEEILTSMRDRYKELAGCDSDEASDIGIRLRVLAGVLHDLESRLSELRLQVFPQTSTGVYLDRHATCRGLFRREAAAASGRLRFSRETAASTDIAIPAGTISATRFSPQLQFATAEAGVLPAGQTGVEIPAIAVEPGSDGCVAAGAVCLLVSSLPGITGVTNPEPFDGGLDTENDDALRERLLAAYRNISNGTNTAFYHDIAMQEPGVLAAGVIPRARGRGTVDVVVKCASAYAQNIAAENLRKVFAHRREINVDVEVLGAVYESVGFLAEIAFADEHETTAVSQQCSIALKGHIAGMGVGEPLLLATLYKLLIEVDGVKNVRILTPAADVVPDTYTAVKLGSLSIHNMAVTQ